MPLLSSLLYIPFERGERNTKHLDNFSLRITVIYGSQNTLTYILRVRFHQLTPEKNEKKQKIEIAHRVHSPLSRLARRRSVPLSLQPTSPISMVGNEPHQESNTHAHKKRTHANHACLTSCEQRHRCSAPVPCSDDAKQQCTKVGPKPQPARF